MLLENKNAVIYGAGGGIGGAVAHAFARDEAKLFLAGRTLAKVEAVGLEPLRQPFVFVHRSHSFVAICHTCTN